MPRARLTVMVLVPFAVLLAIAVREPRELVFDETHYVPAADALARLADDVNWEHPPLSKWLLGVGARVAGAAHLASEPASHRLVSALFGLWALATVLGLLLDLGMPPWAAGCATWLGAVNVLWFVQSRTAMPDVFAAAFALAGLRRVRRGGAGWGPWLGWAFLGLAMACKWSAAPLCVLAFFWAGTPLARRLGGVAVALVAYVLPFLPLAILQRHATPIDDLVRYQWTMLEGFGRVDLSSHPYHSAFWQWPTLLRPAWYHFERTGAGDRYVWAGGNPLLDLCALPATLWVGVRALRRGAAPEERGIALLYWGPLAFWAMMGRSQIYYYFLPASLWLGPAVVWAVRRAAGADHPRAARVSVVALTVACTALFIWFLPLFDGRLQPVDTYQRYMWLAGWR